MHMYIYRKPSRCSSDRRVENRERFVFITLSRLLQLLAVCSVCAGLAVVTESDNLFEKGTVFTASIVSGNHKDDIYGDKGLHFNPQIDSIRVHGFPLTLKSLKNDGIFK